MSRVGVSRVTPRNRYIILLTFIGDPARLRGSSVSVVVTDDVSSGGGKGAALDFLDFLESFLESFFFSFFFSEPFLEPDPRWPFLERAIGLGVATLSSSGGQSTCLFSYR